MFSILRFLTFSIRRRMLAGRTIVIALILAMTAAGHYQLNQAKATGQRVAPYSAQIGLQHDFSLALTSLDADLERFLVIGGTQAQEDVTRHLDTMNEVLESIRVGTDARMAPLIEELALETNSLQTSTLVLLDRHSSETHTREVNRQILGVYSRIDRVRSLYQDLSAETLGLLYETVDKQQSMLSSTVTVFLVFAVSTCLIVVVASAAVMRSIAFPIANLAQTATQIASGNLDLQAKTGSGHEIDRLATAFNRMTARLRDLISGLEQKVSEMEETQRALQFKNALLSTQQETSLDGILVLDDRGEIVVLNQRFADLWDLPSHFQTSLSVEHLRPFLSAKLTDPDGSLARTENLYANPDLRSHEEIELADGRVLDSYSTSMFGTDGTYYGRVWYFRDITERRRSSAEILRLQHLLQNITNSMPSALIALDPEGHVLIWNPAAETLTGLNAQHAKGQSLWHVCPELTAYRSLFEQALHDRQVAEKHREAVEGHPDGPRYRDVDVFPLLSNSIEGAVLRIDDVTQRVHMEENLFQSAKMASVGALAAGVAHEINNPLGAMMQSAQVLEIALDTQLVHTCERLHEHGIDPDALDDYVHKRGLWEYLEGIRSVGARAAKIVSDLLDFTRKRTSKMAPHDLNALTAQSLDLASADYDLRRQYDFRNVETVCDLAPNLPQTVCDKQQIQQVILNLVRNAAQAMAADKETMQAHDAEWYPKLTIRTSLQQETTLDRETGLLGEWVRLEVEDNGPGIPSVALDRLFEPFFTTKDVGRGTGLGLWVCWSIVHERHRGRIWAENLAEGGARFVVELPLSRDAQEQPPEQD